MFFHATQLAMAAIFIPATALAQDSDSPQKKGKLAPFECGKVKRIHTLDGIFLASQPSKDDFKQAKEGGVKTVVNLRENKELDFDEGKLVTGLGMTYYHLPFSSPAALTNAVFDRSRALLKDNKKRPLLLHCASANRVGAIWLVYRVLDDKLSYPDALKEAKQVGLRTTAYEEKAKAYIKQASK